MTTELSPVDIGQFPALASLIEEVAATGKRRRITRDGKDIAVLLPAIPTRARRRTVHRATAPPADVDGHGTQGAGGDHVQDATTELIPYRRRQ